MAWAIEFLTREEIDELHSDSLMHFGGIHGVRDDSLVESAIGAAVNEHYYGGGDEFSVAAAYAYHIAQNQAFLDGNKRTAVAAALTFLAINGHSADHDEDDRLLIYNALIAIAERRMTKPELAILFRKLFGTEE
jgi:death-on-curing protein